MRVLLSPSREEIKNLGRFEARSRAWLGRAYQAGGRYKDAVQQYSKAIALNTKIAEAYQGALLLIDIWGKIAWPSWMTTNTSWLRNLLRLRTDTATRACSRTDRFRLQLADLRFHLTMSLTAMPSFSRGSVRSGGSDDWSTNSLPSMLVNRIDIACRAMRWS